MSQRPTVVIAGGGFGGLEAAKALRRADVDVVVLDRENHHCFQPLLYQVATAALSPADVAWPIRSILRHQANATVLMAEVTGVDTRAKRVLTDKGPVAYDHLVLATGSTHSYFGHDEWAGVAPGLKRIEDATHIRRRILLAFEQAEATSDEAERRRLLNFVVVGGGPTGVEMAGAIAEIARLTLADDFRNIDPRKARVVLLEAGPRLLPALPEDLSDYAAWALSRMDVDVLTGQAVTACDAGGVTAAGRRIEAATVIWAAGVVASPVARWLEVAADRAGRVEVQGELSVPGRADVYVIGDAARVVDARGTLVPGLASAAKQMGTYVGRAIAARVAGEAPPEPFRYRDYGMFATIGRRAAAAVFGGVHLKGLVGWLTWCVAHVYFLIGMRNRFVVAFNWLWDYVTLQRGARLITDVPAPAAPSVAEPERKSVAAL
jgi:NADH dehydrogenase